MVSENTFAETSTANTFVGALNARQDSAFNYLYIDTQNKSCSNSSSLTNNFDTVKKLCVLSQNNKVVSGKLKSFYKSPNLLVEPHTHQLSTRLRAFHSTYLYKKTWYIERLNLF